MHYEHRVQNKKIVSLIFLLLAALLSYGQLKPLPSRLLQMGLAQNRHGTGDITGISFNFAYSQFFSRKVSWHASISSTLHDGSKPLFYAAPNGNIIDGSVRYTTGGVQLAGAIGYSFVRTMHHEVLVRLGPLARYQSTSYPDDVTIVYPAASGLPIPVVYFNNKTPARTFSVGGNLSLGYNYIFKQGLLLGIYGGIQADTNADTLYEWGVTVGKRF